MTIKTLNSRFIYENPWMRLREDQVEWPGGRQGIYGVLEKPNFAVVIPYAAGEVYLVDQYRYPIGQRTLEFPMGALDGDPSAGYEAVAVTELREETGLSAGRLTDLGLAHAASGYATQSFRTYLATDLSQGEAAPAPEEGDLRALKVSLAAFETMICDGRITDAHTLAAFLLFKLKVSPADLQGW